MPDGSTTQRLTDEQLDALVARVKAGEYLDEYLRPLLFRQAKEYELEYASKTPKSRVLSDTMAVPLQPLKQFGTPNGEWTNKLIFGDNLQVLKTLMEMKGRGELRNADGSDGVRVCYIDPPFATKREFRGSRNQRAYRDKIEGAAFVEFLRRRLVFICELLAEDGTLYVHLDTKKGHYMKVVLDELLGANNFRNEIIWHYYNKMQGNIGRFPSNHDCIYVYGKGPGTYFGTIMEEREETATLIKRVWDQGKGKLVNAKDDEGRVIYIEREDKRVDDVWRLSMLQPADHTERVDYPTQKPMTLLNIVLAASSKPGDLVLDAFVGSGTTAVAAERMGRRWVAIDSGKLAIYMTQRRLLSVKQGKGKKAKPIKAQPFELCSAGLYDNDLVEAMPFEGFQNFCLELFDCREQPHIIGGIQMAGTRRGGPVHFFPFKETDAEMGRDYIESLHGRLKGKVTGEVYVVAPVTACDPGLFEDVVVVDKITFFILRVPYSVIEALHGRRFKLLDQPYSAEMVNDPMDTFGFDFVQLPEVDVRYTKAKTTFTGSIRSFMRGGLDPDDFDELDQAGRLDLAMVLIDRDYDGDVFRVSDHFFGDELESSDWKFVLPLADCGKRILVIYMDTHGNEFRETIELAKLKTPAKRSRAAKK